MRLLATLLLVSVWGLAQAAHGGPVWVPGGWCGSGSSRTWVEGRYSSGTQITVISAPACPPPVVVHHVPVAVRPPMPCPPPTPACPGPGYVWVPGTYVWDGCAWAWRGGYWQAPVYHAPVYHPAPACPPRPSYHRPAVGVSIGIGLGHHHGHHHGHGHGHHRSRHSVPPIPFLPGSHALPKPPKHLPDPLGLFKHDPLGLIRR